MTHTHTPHPSFPEPDLRMVLASVWRARLFLIVGAAMGLMAGAGFLALAVPAYRAEMILAPAAQNTSADLATLLGDYDLPGLQYIIKRSGSSESADFVRLEHSLHGSALARRLLEDPDLRAGFAADRTYVWETGQGIQSPEELAAYLAHKIVIAPVGTTMLRRISYVHPDRAFAALLLTRLYGTADGIVRDDVRESTRARIGYLRALIGRTEHPDHRRALTAVLMEQEQVRMLLHMDRPFAAAIVEPPWAGHKPHWPHPPIVLCLAAFAGAFAGFVAFRLIRET